MVKTVSGRLATGTFAEKLKDWMDSAGLRREQVAAITGASERTVRYWLAGEAIPGLDLIVRVSDLTGIEIRDIILSGKRTDTPSNAA